MKSSVDSFPCEKSVDLFEIARVAIFHRADLRRIARVPFLTIGLIVLSILYFVTVNKPPSNKFLEWILSPIIHDPLDSRHLIGNVIALALVGPLIELWIAPTSLRRRFKLFLIGYGINEILAVRSWWVQGEPSYGLSLYILEFVAFALYYYMAFPFPQSKAQRIAPIAIGFVVGFWFNGFYHALLQKGLIVAAGEDRLHLLAFLIGLLVTAFYFKKKKEA